MTPTSWIPLTFVLVLNMGKEAVEDVQRRRMDTVCSLLEKWHISAFFKHHRCKAWDFCFESFFICVLVIINNFFALVHCSLFFLSPRRWMGGMWKLWTLQQLMPAMWWTSNGAMWRSDRFWSLNKTNPFPQTSFYWLRGISFPLQSKSALSYSVPFPILDLPNLAPMDQRTPTDHRLQIIRDRLSVITSKAGVFLTLLTDRT